MNLHTKNSRKAMTMLDRIFQAFPLYNQELDIEAQTSKEELEALSLCDPTTQQTITKSLLFRFMHITLVDMYENQDNKTFSNLYKHDRLENEYIIWNEDCRNHLIASLRAHFKPVLDEILIFLQKGYGYYKTPGNLPLYHNRFKGKITFKSLNEEVKIDKYYARMWTRNAA